MMRNARVVPMLFVITLCSAAALEAQPAASNDMRGYAEINGGATLGHKSDASIGAEAGYQVVMPNLDVFGEFGHIGNAASADLESRANAIANNVGATADVVAKVNYFDFGVRYRFVVKKPNVHPYVALGIGGAHVTTETTLSVNGSAVPPGTLVTFGSDLNGSETAPFLMIGGGATVSFASRYFADISYRFGRVFGKSETSGSETVTVLDAFNTNRVQVGLGIKF